jgi:ubiquinone/menaquinone biosynthesis C-methylase UbiE
MLSRKELWHRLWAYRRIYWLARGQVVKGCLSSPMAAQPFVNQLLIRGTATAAPGTSFSIRCRLNGQEVASWQFPTRQTEAVPQTFPFEAAIPAHELSSSAGWMWLRLTAQVADGAERLLDSFPIRHVSRVSAPRPRHEYGRVWDEEVRDLSSARVAVAGYDDDLEWQRSGLATATHIKDALELNSTDVVLEIGCGAGRVGQHLAAHVSLWIGADTSAKMLKHAQGALKGVKNVSFVHLNGYDLHGVESGSVDAVYCTAVFMHLDEWDRYRYIVEAHRVLRPGGRLYVDNFDLRSSDGWKLFLEMAKLDPAVRPSNVSKASTEQELSWYAERAGFTVRRVETGALFVTLIAERPHLLA